MRISVTRITGGMCVCVWGGVCVGVCVGVCFLFVALPVYECDPVWYCCNIGRYLITKPHHVNPRFALHLLLFIAA